MPTPEPAVLILARQYLREPSLVSGDSVNGWTLAFTPPLTTAEQATFADLQTMANFGVTLTLTEWQAIKADAVGLKTYFGLATPTLVQTAAATKAIIHVLSVIVRD